MEVWWEIYGGFVVLGLFATLIPLSLWVGYWLWEKKLPRGEWYRGVGITYFEDAVQPWPGLFEAIDTMWVVASDDYSHSARKLMNFWIRVVPWSGTIRGNHAQNGTVDIIRLYGLFKPTYIVEVRQLRNLSIPFAQQEDTSAKMGGIALAHTSALFHEAAEHFWPYILGKGLSPDPKGHKARTGKWCALTDRLKGVHHGLRS